MMFERNAEKLLGCNGVALNRDDYFARADALAAAGDAAGNVRIINELFNDELDLYETIPLWPDGAVSVDAGSGQRAPRLAFFPAAGTTGPTGCVIVAPGGAYNCICAWVEGYPIIQRLVKAGISCALLSYRLKPHSQYDSVKDIERAVRVLRGRAGELGIIPDKIGVHGSSAGGHLSLMGAVHGGAGDVSAEDPVERLSSRPDAAVISYGAYSLSAWCRVGDFVHYAGEFEGYAIRGEGLVSPIGHRDQRHRAYFSAERHVTPDTPPMFLWQTSDEDDPRNLFNLGHALACCGVRFEMHIFPNGPHGMGVGEADPHVGHWVELATEWLKGLGF